MTRHASRRMMTLPNLLSVLRLMMIPGFVIAYSKGDVILSAAVLVLSGLTDVLDGWIARRFHAISDLGKVLDPVADKLTIAVVLSVLVEKHPVLLIPLVLLVIKELVMAVSGALAVVTTKVVPGAVWHGKINTALTYMTMFLHILWQDIPAAASNIMAVLCTAMMLLSMTLYTADNIRRCKCGRGGSLNAQ